MYSTKGLNGDGVVIKYPKSAGFYIIKIGTKNEIQLIFNKCNLSEVYNVITMAKRFFDGNHDEKFPYMMLSRLIMDCEYYKEHPQHKNLWAGNPQDHEAAMREVYDLCPIKPEWCSREQLEEYISMLK